MCSASVCSSLAITLGFSAFGHFRCFLCQEFVCTVACFHYSFAITLINVPAHVVSLTRFNNSDVLVFYDSIVDNICFFFCQFCSLVAVLMLVN